MNATRYTSFKAARGFTIVETLVYILVLVLVAGAAVSVYLSLDTTLMRNRAERMITHDATVSLERITRAIRDAENVHVGLSTFGTSPGVLTLNGAATTTQFSLSGGRLVVSEEGTSIGPLTSDGTTVESIIFWRYDNTDTELVRVALTLSASNKAASTTRTFYSSAVVRGSYE